MRWWQGLVSVHLEVEMQYLPDFIVHPVSWYSCFICSLPGCGIVISPSDFIIAIMSKKHEVNLNWRVIKQVQSMSQPCPNISLLRHKLRSPVAI